MSNIKISMMAPKIYSGRLLTRRTPTVLKQWAMYPAITAYPWPSSILQLPAHPQTSRFDLSGLDNKCARVSR
ncbi:MAG: hypothetical protein MRK00_00140 [Nitrosomonas sp.]|nr:hypothetical protein [Nitrosomonas sp.]